MAAAIPALAAAVGVAFALVHSAYGFLRHVVTAIHEAGHALVALLTGRQLQSIRLNRDSSGETVSVGKSTGAGVVATLLAGYPAPSLVGLAGALAVTYERTGLWVLVLLVVLGCTLVLLRNLFGAFVVLLVVGSLAALLHWADDVMAPAAVLLWSAFLLVAGLRGTVELMAFTGDADDARSLAAATSVPAPLWKLLFFAISVACLGAGGWLVWQLLAPPLRASTGA